MYKLRISKNTFLIIILFFISTSIFSQNSITFSQLSSSYNSELIGVGYYTSTIWGDINRDGLLDLVIAGRIIDSYEGVTKVYRNNGNGTFTDTNADIVGVWGGSLDFGDYDNDGDLDLLITGYNGHGISETGIAYVYRNENGIFLKTDIQLQGVYFSNAKWFDFDNDGDSDILLTGLICQNPFTPISKIYRNESGNFSEVITNLIGIGAPNNGIGLADYNKDGFIDIVLAGSSNSGTYNCYLYKNLGDGTFQEINNSLLPVGYGSINWLDFDNDGDIDLLICGSTGPSPSYPAQTKLFQNDGGTFTESGIQLPGFYDHSVSCADINNDGWTDILFTGSLSNTNASRNTKIFLNNLGAFSELSTNLQGICIGSSSWGDFNNDGNLDLVLSGSPYHGGYASYIYQSSTFVKNTAPSSPENLASVVSGNMVTLTWDAGSDLQTPQNGLTNNIRIGKTPGGSEVVSAMANNSTGLRLLAKDGNTGANKFLIAKNLQPGRYYWSVQTIDNGFLASPFTNEQTFTVGQILVVVDIKPGSDENAINLKSKGVLPVAVLTTKNFDAKDVDPNSVQFGPNKTKAIKWNYEDVDFDGDVDLMMHFDNQLTGLTSSSITAGLIGKTKTGLEFQGADKVSIVPKAKKESIENHYLTNIPSSYNLAQNFPNPFNPTTQISFDIPNQSYVDLRIYDVLGKEVAILSSAQHSPGSYTYSFNAATLPSGIYFYHINAGSFQQTRKMLLIK